MKISLYLHIPFCSKKCAYCTFYSIPYHRDTAKLFIQVLCREIRRLESQNFQCSTIYIGGGTPSILDSDLIEKLLEHLSRFLVSSKENTIEVNPESFDFHKASLYRSYGLNRVSIGVQTFCGAQLALLGRKHSSRQAQEAVAACVQAGFKNISVDMLCGLPGNFQKDLESQFQVIVKAPITHISWYMLSCEKGTELFRKVKAGGIRLPNEEDAVCQYYFGLDFLKNNGFQHYEISNFAKNGFLCQHNLCYWNKQAYVGLGPSAVSYLNGQREQRVASVEAYIRRAHRNESVISCSEKLSSLRQAREYAAISIRRIAGIDYKDFEEKTSFAFECIYKNEISVLRKQGLIIPKKHKRLTSGVCLTRKGIIFCDFVSRTLV